MSFFDYFRKRPKTASLAKDRLSIIVARERAGTRTGARRLPAAAAAGAAGCHRALREDRSRERHREPGSARRQRGAGAEHHAAGRPGARRRARRGRRSSDVNPQRILDVPGLPGQPLGGDALGWSPRVQLTPLCLAVDRGDRCSLLSGTRLRRRQEGRNMAGIPSPPPPTDVESVREPVCITAEPSGRARHSYRVPLWC